MSNPSTFNIPPNGLEYKVAATLSHVEQAWRLVYRTYLQQGIIKPNPHEIHCTPAAVNTNTAVIVGRISSLTVSTISIVQDGDQGLPIDMLYRDELTRLRDSGQRLIEVGMFADRRTHFGRSFYSVIEMLRYAYWYGKYVNSTHFVCGVAHKRVKLMEHLFGFQSVGEPCPHPIVNAQLTQLMVLDLNTEESFEDSKQAIDYFKYNSISSDEYIDRFDFSDQLMTGSTIKKYLSEYASSSVACGMAIDSDL